MHTTTYSVIATSAYAAQLRHEDFLREARQRRLVSGGRVGRRWRGRAADRRPAPSAASAAAAVGTP